MRRTLLGRRAATLLVVAAFAAAALPVLVASEPPPTPPPALCDGGTPHLLPATVTTHVTVPDEKKCNVKVPKTLTVQGPNGHLDLAGVVATFEKDATLTVQSGGKLTVRDAWLRAPTTSPNDAWRLLAAPGSTVALDGVRATDARGITVQTQAFTARGVSLIPYHETGLSVVGGKAVLTDVFIESGPIALAVDQGARVEAVGLLVRSTSVAELVIRDSVVNATRLELRGAAPSPLDVIGTGVLRINGLTTPPEAPRQARLSGAEPLLELFDAAPPWDAAQSVLFGEGTGGQARFGTTVVVQVVDEATGGPVAGATVEYRRTPEAQPSVVLTTDAEGLTDAARVVARVTTRDGTQDEPELNVFVHKLHNVATATRPHAESASEVPFRILLPQAPDHDPPGWVDVPLPLSAPAWTATGTVRLAWEPAEDPGEHHAVSHYLVHRKPTASGDAPSIVKVFGTHHDAKVPSPSPVEFWVVPVDLAGNHGTPASDGVSNVVAVRHDPDPPVVTTKRTGTAGLAPGWFRSETVEVEATATDALSGLHALRIVAPGATGCGEPTTDATVKETVEGEGDHVVRVRACDVAGHLVQVNVSLGNDRTPPHRLDVTLTPGAPDGLAGWYTEPVTLAVAAEDALSGIHRMRYRLSAQGPWTGFTNETSIATSGAHVLTVAVADRAGNERMTQRLLHIDTQAPTLTVALDGPAGQDGWYRGPVTVRLTATDTVSGVEEVGWRTPTMARTATDATIVFDRDRDGPIRFHAIDKAGNLHETAWQDLRIDAEPPVPPLVVLQPPAGGSDDWRLDWSAAPPVDATSGLSRLEVHRSTDGTRFDHVVTTPPEATGTVLPLVAGVTNHFFVRAVDAAGWHADSHAVNLKAPGQAGALGRADDGALRLGGLHTFTTDPPDGANVSFVSFYLDGSLVAATASAPYEWTVDTRTLSDGRHELRVLVARTDGSTAEELILFEVRNAYPARLVDAMPFLVPLLLLNAAGLATAVAGHLRVGHQARRAAEQTQGRADPRLDDLRRRRLAVWTLAANHGALAAAGFLLPALLAEPPAWAWFLLLAAAAILLAAGIALARGRGLPPLPDDEVLRRETPGSAS